MERGAEQLAEGAIQVTRDERNPEGRDTNTSRSVA